MVEVMVGEAQISVNYGRPELQGRDMLSRLQDGQVWRLGMNEATSFETDKDLAFGDTVIPAGRYSLFTRKISSNEWRLIFNSEADIWGTQRNPANDVTEVPLEKTTPPESMEQFTIELEETGANTGEIRMRWSMMQLSTEFAVK